jgi:hypothetical protein
MVLVHKGTLLVAENKHSERELDSGSVMLAAGVQLNASLFATRKIVVTFVLQPTGD